METPANDGYHSSGQTRLDKNGHHNHRGIGGNEVSKMLSTWGGSAKFDYEGSVADGTDIWYGLKPWHSRVTGDQYAALLKHFKGRTVLTGTPREPPSGSVGEWLQQNVEKRALASYVGAILVCEGYAQRVPGESSMIRFVRVPPYSQGQFAG